MEVTKFKNQIAFKNCSTWKHNKLKQMKTIAVAQNNSFLQHQWARKFYEQFDFDKHCGEREGQATLHFPEDTIRGGTKSFSNVKKKKKEKVKRKKKRNKLGNTPLISFSIPLEKDPETIFFFFSSKKKKKPALTIQLTMGLWDNYSLPVFVKTDKCSTRRRATPCN